jgi:subtilisin-like proprotein convertase family protein
MDQDLDGTGGEDPDDVYTATFTISDIIGFHSDDVPAPIPWAAGVGSFLTIDQDITITDLNVQLNIDFPYDGDLAIYLESPDGTQVMLSSFNGGLDSDFADTIFDDEALVPISQGFGPFEGSYRPDGALSDFDGENARGQWTLWIENWIFSLELDSEGWLDAWSLVIGGDGGSPPPPPPPPDPANRPPVAVDDSLQGETNTVLAFTSAELLVNDTDPDDDPLAITFWGAPSSGGLNVRPDGLITFTPNDGFTGEVTFQYIVSDGTLTDTGTVTIDIQPPRSELNNETLPLDVNADRHVTAQDALIVFNLVNTLPGGSTPIEFVVSDVGPTYYYDVSSDGFISAIDALQIFNYLNAQAARGTPDTGSSVSAASGSSTQSNSTQAATTDEQHAAAVDHLILCDALNQLLQNHRRRTRP